MACCGDVCVDTSTDTNNCGRCGNVCAQPHATPICSAPPGQAPFCDVVSCDQGYVYCPINGVPRTLAGCECEGTGCCSNACQTKHSNGVGGFYYDCSPLGTPGVNSTYTQTMALEAATSDTGQAGSVSSGWSSGSGADVATAVCKTAGNGTSGTCTCWVYNGAGTTAPTVGHVFASSNGCFNATATDPTWT